MSTSNVGHVTRSMRVATAMIICQVVVGYVIFVFPGSLSGYNFLLTGPIIAAWLPGSVWGAALHLSSGLGDKPTLIPTVVGAVAVLVAFLIFRGRYIRIAYGLLLAVEVSCIASVMGVALYFTNPGQEPSEQFVGLVDVIIFGGVPAIVPVTVCALLLRKSSRMVVTGPKPLGARRT